MGDQLKEVSVIGIIKNLNKNLGSECQPQVFKLNGGVGRDLKSFSVRNLTSGSKQYASVKNLEIQ